MGADRAVVAIVGRPNVGKSTLFNRLAGQRIAVVEETPGITRDRIYADCIYRGRPFSLVDTGGLQPRSEDSIIGQVKKQAQFAIDEADLILFVTDGKEGLTTLDYEIAELLRQTGKPTLLLVNKVESPKREMEATDFYALAMGEPLCISAMHGLEIGELLEALLPYLPEAPESEDESIVRVALVGRPNVGKSSLINALLGKDRMIVTDIPGTTRDAVDTPFEYSGKPYILIDTAGIRRKTKVKESFDYYSVLRAFGAIERSDVAVLVLDATQGVTDQDKRISGKAHEEGCAQIIVANKWDLLMGDAPEANKKALKADFEHQVREQLPFAAYAPFLPVSAHTRQALSQMLELIDKSAQARSLEISTGELNRVIGDALSTHPFHYRGKALKVYYSTQVKNRPPAFLLFVNNPDAAHFSTVRFLENTLRRKYLLEGTPVRFIVRQSKGKPQA